MIGEYKVGRTNTVDWPYTHRRVQLTVAFLVSVAVMCHWPATLRSLWGDPEQELDVVGEGSPLLQIELNTADHRELALLPGVGPVLAERIVADRASQGPFPSVAALARVKGIGPKTVQEIEKICVVDREHSFPGRR